MTWIDSEDTSRSLHEPENVDYASIFNEIIWYLKDIRNVN